MKKITLMDLDQEALKGYLKEAGFPAFRGQQLFQWIHSKQAMSFEEMKNLPKELKAYLQDQTVFPSVSLLDQQVSKDQDTKKLLFSLHDDHVVEGVLMKYKYGYSLCLSTQVGCRMNCSFCASALGGLVRNLTAGEMLGQVYEATRLAGERISHLVLMGSGEPLDNYEEVIKFLKLINHEDGYHLSHRNITLSTSGLVKGIRRLADEHLQITLAISLHAPTNELRLQTMPVNKANPIEELMQAVDYYVDKTHRRVTFEYALIKGVNDGEDQAKALAKLLKGKLCHVNLIPINEVREKNYLPTKDKEIQNFMNILSRKGINVTIRRELGSDINAACGQLRNDYLKKK